MEARTALSCSLAAPTTLCRRGPGCAMLTGIPSSARARFKAQRRSFIIRQALMTLFYRTVLLASVAVFTSDGLYCQARAILETFSIQPSAATDSRSPIRVSADTIQAANATLRQLIAYAYDLQEIQILGPEWIE